MRTKATNSLLETVKFCLHILDFEQIRPNNVGFITRLVVFILADWLNTDHRSLCLCFNKPR